MLKEKLTTEERELMELWHYPPAIAEVLFSNFDNLGEFHPDKLGSLRKYQYPSLSYEPFIDVDMPGLNDQEKFNMKKMVGDIVNVGGRGYGKSLVTLIIDICISILHDEGLLGAFYSIDEKRLRGILTRVERACKYHPILKDWDVVCHYRPNTQFSCKRNNWQLTGVNLTLKGKSPGEQWYQLHVSKIWGDEVSFETDDVAKKREASSSDLGVIIRLAGMTNFTRHSPIGREFFDPNNKYKLTNYPEYVRDWWNEDKKRKRIKEHQGKETITYRIFVDGRIVENAETAIDMERVEGCFNRKTDIKHFELTKKNWKDYPGLIVVKRPKNAERIIIAADVGDSSMTEIIILSEVGDKYNYLYNISLHGLITEEQYEIFKWLSQELEANILAFDCGEHLGRALSEKFETLYGKNHVVRYDGSAKVKVGFEKDENGKVKYEKGKPVHKYDRMKVFAVERLKELCYAHRINMPYDNKVDVQFTEVIQTASGDRVLYACTAPEDHMFSAWLVFFIAQWLKKDFNKTPKVRKKRAKGISSWIKEKKSGDINDNSK